MFVYNDYVLFGSANEKEQLQNLEEAFQRLEDRDLVIIIIIYLAFGVYYPVPRGPRTTSKNSG